MLPISMSGWGVRESSMIAVLGGMGVDPGRAVIPSILFGLCIAVAALPGGLVWLSARMLPAARRRFGISDHGR